MTWEIRQGGALQLLREMSDASVQCCVTSPPYWGLRDYGTATWEGGDAGCEHKGRPKPQRDTSGGGPNHGRFSGTRGTQPAKAIHAIPVRAVCPCGARRVDEQLGLEETPDEYVERLVEILREVRRALRPDGTLWLNLGDSYAAHGAGGYGKELDYMGDAIAGRARRGPPPGLKSKDLVGIPWAVAFALRADGWYLRSDVIWHKPNPMPESVTDRPTKAHEYVFLLSKAERYFYDGPAVAEQLAGNHEPNHPRTVFDNTPPPPPGQPAHTGLRRYSSGNKARTYGGAVGDRPNDHMGRSVPWVDTSGTRNRRSVWAITTEPFAEAHFAVMPQALVEPCILAGSRPGDIVLDPFAGSGTVGVVALRHGRCFLGLELNQEYAAMARRRIAGPLFAEAVRAATHPPRPTGQESDKK